MFIQIFTNRNSHKLLRFFVDVNSKERKGLVLRGIYFVSNFVFLSSV